MPIALSILAFHTFILTTVDILLLSKYHPVFLYLSCCANFCLIVHGMDIAKAKWQAKHIKEPSSRSSNTNLFARRGFSIKFNF
jgi:threonine/homoserine/homoserine lactone efflux protein